MPFIRTAIGVQQPRVSETSQNTSFLKSYCQRATVISTDQWRGRLAAGGHGERERERERQILIKTWSNDLRKSQPEGTYGDARLVFSDGMRARGKRGEKCHLKVKKLFALFPSSQPNDDRGQTPTRDTWQPARGCCVRGLMMSRLLVM